MKKSRKQKSRKIKKSKTRKQKGGDNCEKNNILEKLDDSLVKYKYLIDSKKLGTQTQGFNLYLDQSTATDKDEIINDLFNEIKKCDNIKDLINLIKRKKNMSFYSSYKKEFYKNLLKKIESYIGEDEEKIIREDEEIIIRELSKSFERYKKSKSTKMSQLRPLDKIHENGMLASIEKIIESQNKTIIESLYETIKNYDKCFNKDIIEKQI